MNFWEKDLCKAIQSLSWQKFRHRLLLFLQIGRSKLLTMENYLLLLEQCRFLLVVARLFLDAKLNLLFWRRSFRNMYMHPIGLIELFGVGAAYHVWKDSLANRKAIFFCDNWAALDVYVKGSSSQRSWRTLLKSLEEIDMEAKSLIWMARIPSQSNISDAPSRGDASSLGFLKPFSIVSASCPVTGKCLESIISWSRLGILKVKHGRCMFDTTMVFKLHHPSF